MANNVTKIVQALRKAHADAWPPTRAFLAWAERQKETPAETVAETLQKELHISKSDLDDLVRGIHETKIGHRIVGRHGSKTRIRWQYSLSSIGRVARNAAKELEQIEGSPRLGAAAQDLVHAFKLRANCTVKLSLPQNLTQREAKRLADFIKTLPFA